jgi:hypothetical protein
MKVVRTIVWIIPMIGVGLAAVILVSGMASATGAPQEAVVAALACAVAILPYCFTRSVSEILDTWTSTGKRPTFSRVQNRLGNNAGAGETRVYLAVCRRVGD